MSEQPDHNLLDENISRMLNADPDRPQLPGQTEQRMLAALQAKQQQLYSRKEETMDSAVPASSARQQAYAVGMGLLAVAAALFAAFLLSWNPAPQREVSRNVVQFAKTIQADENHREELADGTIVIARSGTQYEVVAARQLTLEQGDLYLIVAKSDQPFVVRTKDGSVTALGTRFAVSAGDKTTAAVAQGRVVLAGDAGQIELRPGEQGTVQAGTRPVRQPAPRLSYLVNWAREQLAQEDPLVEKTNVKSGLVAMDPWGQEVRLTLRKYDVDVHIEDGIARTTIDQTFFNHNPWNTEGTFYFPLPPDASVSRLAMYVAGRLNEGGMVERSYGQQVYTDILYQRRDPALLEMMEGNVFKMRIFPLEGRQEKRVFLSYTQTLPELYGTLRYWFPMDHTHNVARQLSLHVRIKDGAGTFDPQSSTHKLGVATDGNDLVLRYDASDVKPDQDFLLNLLPGAELPRERIATTAQGGHRFLFARLRPKLTGAVDHRPRQWVVLRDISASRSAIEAEAQQYILDRLIQEADDDDSVAVIDLNTRATARTDGFVSLPTARNTGFSLANSSSTDRSTRLKSRLLGATSIQAGLQAVTELIERHGADNPHILYLGDGVATVGQTEVFPLVRQIPRGATFVGIGVGKKVESRFLHAAADMTGGMFAVVNPDEDIDWRVFDLVAALNTPRLTGVQVSLESAGRGTFETIAYPSSRVIADGETLQVVARFGDELPDQLVLRGRLGEEPWEKTYQLDRLKTDAEHIPRLWAKRHIDELLKSGPEHIEEIVALSKQYYVVTPHTSLIVLEDDAMYEKYEVERGRQDHWALYPAPPEIEVVKEPVDWSRWGWWGAWQGEDAQVKSAAKPKSIKEIVNSVQFRINAPFYYWRPQQYGQGRHALYQLLDSDTDPTRMLTYIFAVAGGKQPSFAKPQQGTQAAGASPAPGSPDAEPGPTDGKTMPSYHLVMARDVSRVMLGPMFSLDSIPASGPMPSPQMIIERRERDGGWRYVPFDGTSTLGTAVGGEYLPTPTLIHTNGKRMNDLRLGGLFDFNGDRKDLGIISTALEHDRESLSMNLFLPHGKTDKKKSLLSAFVSGQPIGGNFQGGAHDVAQPVMRAFQTALGGRWARIDRDVRNFNRQHGHWQWGEWNGGRAWNGLDLTRSASARWYGGLEGLVGGGSDGDKAFVSSFLRQKAEEEMLPFSVLGNATRSTGVPMSPMFVTKGKDVPAAALMAVYGQAMKTLPGSCAILAADYLVPQQTALRADAHATDKQREIAELALSGAVTAAARLEDSGVFWSHQGWDYRPQPWSFQPPAVQAYPHYNWSFDLTRYAEGLYSSSADVLDEVVAQYGSAPAEGKISDAARQHIQRARAAIRPVRIGYGEGGTDIVAAAGDRFAVSQQTDMYLRERMVCDGAHVLHVYDELGLVARRQASALRLDALRRLAPHFAPPADVIARRFNVSPHETDRAGFTLALTPAVQSDQDEHQYEVLLSVGNDGLVRHKTLKVDGQLQFKLAFGYQDEQVTIRWIDKDDKQLAESSFTARQLDADSIAKAKEKTFEVDLSDQVVFDMPLRRPSYYAQQLEGLDEDNVEQIVSLKRHHALASIQELQWRRWGQTNTEAQKSLTEVVELLHRSGRKALLGDVVLLGSAGVHQFQQIVKDKTDVPDSNPTYRYAGMRSSGWTHASQLRDEHPNSLVGHLSAYYLAAQQQDNSEHFDKFLEDYNESPLVLAAAFFHSAWGSKPETWQRLYDQPALRGMALLMSAERLQTQQQRDRFAVAFKKWYDEIVDSGYEVAIPQQVVNQLRQYEGGQLWQSIVEGKLERAKEQDRTAPLLTFADNAMAWGEAKLADEALKLVRERLDDDDTLLSRLALAQAYWSGGRPKDALKLYEEILTSLDAQHVPATPALLAAAARLAQQAGDTTRAIELEERALAVEHKYLPEMVNLQAFRQRYSWLWQQYESRVQSAVNQKDERAVSDWLSRARTAWQSWFEVDHDNPQMIQQMATLLETAGHSDDAWLYLSTLIDQKPRDAISYYHVGQWYLGRDDPDRAEQYYATAYSWDTANPRWLWERAQVLDKMNRRDEARGLYGQIVNGTWASGLQGYVNQAKEALK